MTRKNLIILIVFFLTVISTACSPAPQPDIQFDPSTLCFSGERAYAIEEEFITTHTYRVSGSDEILEATVWLREAFSAAGWDCEFDDWESVLSIERKSFKGSNMAL